MNRQKLIVIIAAFFLFVCVSLLIVFLTGDTDPEVAEVHYTLDFPLVLPKEPGYSGEYVFTNTPRDRWSEEEAAEWFIEPTGENLDRLSAANDQVIKKILEAAP